MLTVTVLRTLVPVAVAYAVIVTCNPGGGLGDGTVGGAVKIAVAPLALVLGVTVPQGNREQLTLQVTPAFVVSLVTTAITGAVALVNMVVGGASVMLTVTGALTTNVAVAVKL
jgi:hypothetical protein